MTSTPLKLTVGRPGWALDLDVPPNERRHWLANFPEGGDPAVESDEHGLHVRAAALDAAKNADDAVAIGRDILDRMNGLLQIGGAKHPVGYIGVARIDDFGGRHVETKIRGVMAAVEAGDFTQGSIMAPTHMQRQFAAVETSKDLKMAVAYFAEQESWFAVYKCIEALKLLAGSTEALAAKAGVTTTQIDLAQWTANTPRHHPNPRKGVPPPNPMPYHEARELVRQLLASFL